MHREKSYYFNYRDFYNEIIDLGKTIKTELENFKQQIKKNNTNTLKEEKKINQDLEQYHKILEELSNAYQLSKIPPELPEVELDKRLKEIQRLEIDYSEFLKLFIKLRDKKYKFYDEITEDYEKKEEYKDLTPYELMQVGQKRLEEQEKKLKALRSNVKKGTHITHEINEYLKNQNKQSDQIDEDMERVEDRLENLKERMDKFISGRSIKCLVIILVIEIIVALGFYFWFFYS